MNDEISKKIIQEIIRRHDLADIFISLFFASVDVLLYLTIIFIFGCEFITYDFNQRQKLSLLIIIDAFLRIINLYVTSFVYSLAKEIIFTIFASFQFYLIIIILNTIFEDKNNDILFDRLELKYPIISTIIFFIFAISINISKFISLLQYILAIIVVLIYGCYGGSKIELFLSNVHKKNPHFEAQFFVYNLPFFITLYYIVYYGLKICSLYVETKLYLSYMEMGCDIFKEVAKYLCFSMVITIHFLFTKYIREDDYYYDTETSQGVVNISTNINNYN